MEKTPLRAEIDIARSVRRKHASDGSLAGNKSYSAWLYFHLVFTLPHELNRLCQRNPALLYNLLFRCVSETLLEVAADPKHFGAEIGFLAILHSWGQNLLLHPHLHCLVPVSGLAPDRSHWVRPRYRFFLPLGVLKKVFRCKFLDGLKTSLSQKQGQPRRRHRATERSPRHSGLFFNRCVRNGGSFMPSKRWRVQHRCFVIWAAIPTALPSAITGWSPLMRNKSLSVGRTMHAETSSAS